MMSAPRAPRIIAIHDRRTLADPIHLLGIKSTGLHALVRRGFRVPRGFTITVPACADFLANHESFDPRTRRALAKHLDALVPPYAVRASSALAARGLAQAELNVP